MIRRNSIAADVKPMLDAQAIYGLIRNTETSEIRILLYKQPPNCAHTMTYVSTYSRHKNYSNWVEEYGKPNMSKVLHYGNHMLKYIVWELRRNIQLMS